YQILNPGIRLWFAAGEDGADGGPDEGVVGWVRHGGTRVVAGAPVCARQRLGDVTAAFEADAAAHGERVCYFAAESRLESLRPYASLLLGAQPVWRPQQLLDNITGRRSLRAQLRRAANKDVNVVEWSA